MGSSRGTGRRGHSEAQSGGEEGVGYADASRGWQEGGYSQRRTPSVIPMISYEDGLAALEMAWQGLWVSGDVTCHRAGREAVARRDGGR